MLPGATPPTLSRDGDVFFLDLGDSENRLNGDWLTAFDAALDEVEAAEAPRALVTKATGKFWSNGLDLEWLGANQDVIEDFSLGTRRLYGRLLTAPYATVAAIQGHVFAAGAVLALCHDRLVMREDRGYFCLPEVDLNLPFPDGVGELVSARLEPRVAAEAMLTGRRYGGGEALEAGIVDEAVALDQVESAAIAYAKARSGAPGETLEKIKQRLYAPVLEALPIAEGA